MVSGLLSGEWAALLILHLLLLLMLLLLGQICQSVLLFPLSEQSLGVSRQCLQHIRVIFLSNLCANNICITSHICMRAYIYFPTCVSVFILVSKEFVFPKIWAYMHA